MTNLQEAKLAREAEICYATMALVTDYDVWYEGEEDVTLEQVLSNVRRNVETAQAIVRRVVPALDLQADCQCRHAVEHAYYMLAELIPEATKEKLESADRQVSALQCRRHAPAAAAGTCRLRRWRAPGQR